MVEQPLSKELNWVVRSDFISFTEAFRQNKADFVLFEISDVGMLLVEEVMVGSSCHSVIFLFKII